MHGTAMRNTVTYVYVKLHKAGYDYVCFLFFCIEFMQGCIFVLEAATLKDET
jgi:hypothetical protein